jgi:homoserine kinase
VISGAGPSLLALAPAGCAEAVGEAMTRAWQGEGVSSHSAVLGVQDGGSTWAPLAEGSRPQAVVGDWNSIAE